MGGMVVTYRRWRPVVRGRSEQNRALTRILGIELVAVGVRGAVEFPKQNTRRTAGVRWVRWPRRVGLGKRFPACADRCSFEEFVRFCTVGELL